MYWVLSVRFLRTRLTALSRLQSMYLFVRADTIYGGTNQIQRNIIAERGLGMPKEPKGAPK